MPLTRVYKTFLFFQVAFLTPVLSELAADGGHPSCQIIAGIFLLQAKI